MNKKIISIIGILVVVLAFIGGYFLHKAPAAVKGTSNIGDLIADSLTTTNVNGGTAILSENGIVTYPLRKTLAVATTTVCAIQGPNATTSLTASVNFTNSSTTASTVTLALASNAFATTTLLGTAYALPANAMGTVAATTTGLIIGPNQWFVAGMAGGVGNFSPLGTCEASFRLL